MRKQYRGSAAFIAVVFFILLSFGQKTIPAEIFYTVTAHAADNVTIGKPVITGLDNKYKGVFIEWSAVSGADGYNVYRRRKTSEPYTLIKTVSASKLSYTDNDALKESGLYTYMVRAFAGDVLSAESESKTIVRVNITRTSVNVNFKQKSARNMLKLINDFRTGSDAWAWNSTNTQKVTITGLGRLAYDYNLEKIAMLRAAEAALKFGHERPNGKTAFSALDENGYVYKVAGENLVRSCKSVKTAFNALLETNNQYANQTHRRLMLSNEYNVCAVGHVRVNGIDYWALLLAYTQDDSDYTKTKNGSTKITLDIASEDLSSYKKTLKKLDATYKDYEPSAVSIVTKESGKRRASLTFERSTGAQGYEIYRSTSKKGSFELIKRLYSQDRLSYTDKKLSGKKKYYYYVVPYRLVHDDYVYGKKSNVVMIKTQ